MKKAVFLFFLCGVYWAFAVVAPLSESSSKEKIITNNHSLGTKAELDTTSHIPQYKTDPIISSNQAEKPLEIYGTIALFLFTIALVFGLFGIWIGFAMDFLFNTISLSLIFGLILFSISYVRHGENPGKYRGFMTDRPWEGMCLMIFAALLIGLATTIMFMLNIFL